jgi:subtilisin family serine protease
MLQKFIPLGFLFSLALVSCGGTSKILSTPIENIDKMPLKTTPIKDADLMRWSHLDLTKDTIPGMSVDRVYAELIKGKKATKVIVGIVDSGIDINHEDLRANIWRNPKEIPNNKIDDDKNGYIDDVNGWNFLGNAEHEQLEMTRIVKMGSSNPEYAKAKANVDKELAQLNEQKQQVDFIFNAHNTIKKHLNKTKYTRAELNAITSKDEKVVQSKQVMTQVLAQVQKDDFESELNEFKDQVYNRLNYNFNTEFDGRKVVGDNPNDINDKNYGNGNVIGPDPKGAKHGTHVAGIVAQLRGNKKGGDGVASSVEIMAVRAVPDGDEYDKDIALGIRYAVDNGAKVINGSFGKYYSPHRDWVQDALKYAASKDVLVIFAAGNEAYDLDVINKYPSDSYDGTPEISNNVLIIGALNYEYGGKLVANFSNYGKNNVDIYAPGVKIYATTPLNTYDFLQGTSMASPNVAGVAALLRSYFPNLTAVQVKKIIMDSGTPLNNTVTVGEDRHSAKFSEVSKTGKIVNAYKAFLMAQTMSTSK